MASLAMAVCLAVTVPDAKVPVFWQKVSAP